MAELTRERREEMRRRFAFLLEAPLIFETVTIPTADLLALLDAADERDRLREEADRVRALAEQLNVALRNGSADLSAGWACERW